MLLTRYGTRAEDVWPTSKRAAMRTRSSDSTHELSVREVAFMVENEQIGHLIDVLIRRTSLAFRGLVTSELLAETAARPGRAAGLGRGKAWPQEISHAMEILDRFHGVQVQSLIA